MFRIERAVLPSPPSVAMVPIRNLASLFVFGTNVLLVSNNLGSSVPNSYRLITNLDGIVDSAVRFGSQETTLPAAY